MTRTDKLLVAGAIGVLVAIAVAVIGTAVYAAVCVHAMFTMD